MVLWEWPASQQSWPQAEGIRHGQCVSTTQLLILGHLEIGSDEIQEGKNVPLFRWLEPRAHDNEPDVHRLDVGVLLI